MHRDTHKPCPHCGKPFESERVGPVATGYMGRGRGMCMRNPLQQHMIKCSKKPIDSVKVVK